jgi:hypothetical protein
MQARSGAIGETSRRAMVRSGAWSIAALSLTVALVGSASGASTLTAASPVPKT